MARSTISNFLTNKEAIKAANVANGVTIVHSKQRLQIIDEVEKLLLTFIREKELDGDRISEGIIYEKALRIYGDLLMETARTSAQGGSVLTFKASNNRIQINIIHSVARHGEEDK